ncbi:MAG: AMP-binding protein [Candidatus Cyclobacteriaceae bacterium M3_2C_046]
MIREAKDLQKIWIDGQSYFLKDLMYSEYDWNAMDALTRETLTFCREWLQGKKAFEIYTSGSTGKPKCIKVLRNHMQISAETTIKHLGIKPGDRALVCLSPAYIAGRMMLVRGMEHNLLMEVVPTTSNPLTQQNHYPDYDFTAMVPLQMETVLTKTPEKKVQLNHFNAILLGGAPVSFQLRQQIRQLTCPVYSTYGMTETVSHIAWQKLNGKDAHDYFRVLPGTVIEQDQRGCLTITAAVTGYRKIITNDLVDIIAPDKFTWIGRVDEVINSGGIKLHPDMLGEKVEKILLNHKMNNSFFLTGQPDDKLGQKLVMLIESNQPNKDQVKEVLAAHLDKYETPRELYFLPYFDRTDSGKINKLACLKRIN